MQGNSRRKRRIAAVLVDRANYGRLKPVMQAIKTHPDLELQVVCAGTMVLNRFDRPVDIVRGDGFPIESEVFLELEGSNPITMAKSLGFGIMEFASEFGRLQPDIVLVIGDRYEGLAAALAASYMNLCLAHIQGGEVSGSIDESARHCITKLAQYHFPSTVRSGEFIRRMGEFDHTVFVTGCPSSDIAKSIDMKLPADIFKDGVGAEIKTGEEYMLVVYHPVTTAFSEERNEVQVLLDACSRLNKKCVWLWPNIDAGSDVVSRDIRRYRELNRPNWLRLIKNFTPENYLRVLGSASCAVGNSSSFVRDSSYLGTPVVLIGDRQSGREFAENVTWVPKIDGSILQLIQSKIAHGRYAPSTLYGDGEVSQRIASHLASVKPYIQKRLSYLD